MNKDILLKVLQLDSIIEQLQWKERMLLHFQIQNQTVETTPFILSLYHWIEVTHWKAPEMKFGQDRMKYCFEQKTESWLSTEDFIKTDRDLSTFMQLLKY